MTSDRRATLALVGATAAWGSSFVVIKGALATMPAASFLWIRFAIATAFLALLRPRTLSRLSPLRWVRSVLLGCVYGIAQLLQTVGLRHTAPAVSGFVTGMYVVITPLLALLLLRRPITRTALTAVVLATAGIGVLSLHGASVSVGVLLTLASAGLYALHIIGLGAWSEPALAYPMAVVQMAAVSAVCLVSAAVSGLASPSGPGPWASIVYTAIVPGALALLAQTWAQSHMDPSRAAVIMTLEPVFAAAFALGSGVEAATWRLSGGGLVVGAMYLVESDRSSSRPEPVASPHLAEGG